MRQLAGNGLVELTWKTQIVETRRKRKGRGILWDQDAGDYRQESAQQICVERAVERRAVRLTPLGSLIVDRLRPELEHGRRIRWDSLIDKESPCSLR
ncbi:MAG TPA: hypothetical protein VF898_10770 [Chloroflexota bacterium]